MLTKEEFHHNLRIINTSCKLGIIPLELNNQNERLQLLESRWKKAVCSIYFAMYSLHASYVALRLPYLLITGAPLPLLSLVVHITVMLGMLTAAFSGFKAFFCYPDITATCFNKAFEDWGCVPQGNFIFAKLKSLVLFQGFCRLMPLRSNFRTNAFRQRSLVPCEIQLDISGTGCCGVPLLHSSSCNLSARNVLLQTRHVYFHLSISTRRIQNSAVVHVVLPSRGKSGAVHPTNRIIHVPIAHTTARYTEQGT